MEKILKGARLNIKKEIMKINVSKLLMDINNLRGKFSELRMVSELILKMINRQEVLDEMKTSVDINYSIYIPSKINSVRCILPRLLNRYNILFKLVVEPQDKKSYENKWGEENILVLPENNKGLCYVRNFIIKYSRSIGEKKHWQLDDDIGGFSLVDGEGLVTSVNPTRALKAIETECDKYINIGLAGPANSCFLQWDKNKKYFLCNKLVASCLLVDNTCEYVNFNIDRVEDIDCCLTILSSHYWCTLKFINVLMNKANDLQVSGNYESMGKYKEAVKEIMKKWPGVFFMTNTGRLRAYKIWTSFKQEPLIKNIKKNSELKCKKDFKEKKKIIGLINII